jgi:glycosyltransferase involved in cell wall biosynthesis
MRIAMLAPIAWRTPPRHYGPWELVTSLLTEELVRRGHEVSLFATADSQTEAKLHSVAPVGYEENRELDAKVWECLHISACFERAGEFDLIHNQFDYLPLSYSGLVTTPVLSTIHGFSSPKILEVYKKYNRKTHYVSISNADRSHELDYAATVYHGIRTNDFPYIAYPKGDYLLYYGRIHPDKGTREAVELALKTKEKLLIAGIIQDQTYFDTYVKPHLKTGHIEYIGSVGGDKRAALLGNAKVLLHLINFHEPFGLSVVEAMACGTPVLALKKGSMPELITHGLNGYLAEDIPEAESLLKEVMAIPRYACRQSVEERFTVGKMAQGYEEVYKKIVGQRVE